MPQFTRATEQNRVARRLHGIEQGNATEIRLIRLSCLAGADLFAAWLGPPSVCDAVSADWNLRLNLRRDSERTRAASRLRVRALGLAREVPKASAVAPEPAGAMVFDPAERSLGNAAIAAAALGAAAGHRRRRWCLTSIAVTKMTKRPMKKAIAAIVSCISRAVAPSNLTNCRHTGASSAQGPVGDGRAPEHRDAQPDRRHYHPDTNQPKTAERYEEPYSSSLPKGCRTSPAWAVMRLATGRGTLVVARIPQYSIMSIDFIFLLFPRPFSPGCREGRRLRARAVSSGLRACLT